MDHAHGCERGGECALCALDSQHWELGVPGLRGQHGWLSLKDSEPALDAEQLPEQNSPCVVLDDFLIACAGRARFQVVPAESDGNVTGLTEDVPSGHVVEDGDCCPKLEELANRM